MPAITDRLAAKPDTFPWVLIGVEYLPPRSKRYLARRNRAGLIATMLARLDCPQIKE